MVLCHRLLGIGPNPSTKDAELIAVRVGEYHSRRVMLPDIGPPSTEGKETFDFCGLIDRTEVSSVSNNIPRHLIFLEVRLLHLGGFRCTNPNGGQMVVRPIATLSKIHDQVQVCIAIGPSDRLTTA